jgi:hypothetical protein
MGNERSKRFEGITKPISRGFEKLDLIPDGIRAAIIPTSLTVLGVVVLAAKGTAPDFWYWLSVYIFAILVILKVLVDYVNLTFSKATQRENEQLRTCLQWVNHAVEEKLRHMAKVAKSTSIADKANRAREIMKFSNTATTLCLGLQNSCISFLNKDGKLKRASVNISLLVPHESGTFKVFVAKTRKGASSSQLGQDTGMSIQDEDTLAGWLWNNSATTYISYGDVEDAIRDMRFRYLYPEQEKHLKSIFCYVVRDARNNMPHSIISIDSDKKGILPNNDSEDAETLAEIVTHFATRLSLDFMYDEILKDVSVLFEGNTVVKIE